MCDSVELPFNAHVKIAYTCRIWHGHSLIAAWVSCASFRRSFHFEQLHNLVSKTSFSLCNDKSFVFDHHFGSSHSDSSSGLEIIYYFESTVPVSISYVVID